jgi:TPR repeat protein
MLSMSEGLSAFESQDYLRAFEILMPIAATGDAEAQCIIANMYHLGLGLEPDVLQAVEWYKKSAEQGYGVASNNLGGIFKVGVNGQAPDPKTSEYWYEKAREQGFLSTIPENVIQTEIGENNDTD